MTCNYCVKEIEENIIGKSKCYYCTENSFKLSSPAESQKDKIEIKKLLKGGELKCKKTGLKI